MSQETILLPDYVPQCHVEALQAIEAGHAFVGCIVHEDTVVTVCSKASMNEVLNSPNGRFARTETPKLQRAAFQLSGLQGIVKELLG